MNDEKYFLDLPPVRSILERLRSGLSPRFTYHSLEHTYDVIREALSLGFQADLPSRALELLAVAAAYHDCGFLEQTRENEAIAAASAASAMKECGGYDAAEVALVCQMIRDTELRMVEGAPRQVPSTRLSPYLLDADLGNLGREDFLEKAQLMLKESGEQDAQRFYSELLRLFENHSWYTSQAAESKTVQKEANLAKLKAMLTP